MVQTGDRPEASTQANVFMTLYGNLGNSGERKLKKSAANGPAFQTGSADTFTVEAAHLGVLQMIVVRHDGKGAGEGWFLEWVEVRGEREPVRFDCEQWLDAGKEDGQIERTLLVSKGEKGTGKLCV